MREKEIEKMLVNAVKIHGGLALKFVSPNFNGMPDRLILLPFGKIAFAEMKAPGRKMRSIKRKRQLESLGFSVYCIDGTEQIGGVLDEIEQR